MPGSWCSFLLSEGFAQANLESSATVENKYNREACFWELPLKSEENDPTQGVKRFRCSAGINVSIHVWTFNHKFKMYKNYSLTSVLVNECLFLHTGSHRERLGLIRTQVLSQVRLWNITLMASTIFRRFVLIWLSSPLFQMQSPGWRP